MMAFSISKIRSLLLVLGIVFILVVSRKLTIGNDESWLMNSVHVLYMCVFMVVMYFLEGVFKALYHELKKRKHKI